MKCRGILIIIIMVQLLFDFNFMNETLKEMKKSNNSANTGKMDSELVKYSCSYGGDMQGGHCSTMITRIDGERALVSLSSAEWHNQYPKVEEYYVPASVLDSIEKLYHSYKIKRFPKLPKSPVIACDAGTTSYCFQFDGGLSITFSNNQMITSNGYEGLRKINNLIEEAIEQSEQLPGLVMDNDDSVSAFTYNSVQEGVCELRIVSYENNAIYYQVANGLSDQLDLTEKIILYQVNGNERNELYHNDSETQYFVYSNSCHDDSVPLNNMRLERGHYILMVSGYECEFEIR